MPKYLNVLVPLNKYKNTLLRKALFSVPKSSRYGYDLDVLERRVWPLIRWASQLQSGSNFFNVANIIIFSFFKPSVPGLRIFASLL